MCTDGTPIDDYTCDCTDGYSGVNCDTIAGKIKINNVLYHRQRDNQKKKERERNVSRFYKLKNSFS